MYVKIPTEGFNSEKEFENLVDLTFSEGTTREWILGTQRGRKYFELLDLCGYDLSNRTVLDIGSGYGGVSLFLSEKVAEIIGLDVDKDLLSVARKRIKISSRKNSNTILASGNSLPLKDNCVDAALMIGVLEWVPLSDPFSEPGAVQLETLKKICRILKKDGVFLLAIENRFYLGYWLGRKDHHTGLRFIPLLPRRISNFAYKMLRGKPYYLERTYSYFELKEILAKAGFTIARMCVGIPSYTCPSGVASIDDKKGIKQTISLVRWGRLNRFVWKAINLLGLMKVFCSNFLFICEPRD